MCTFSGDSAGRVVERAVPAVRHTVVNAHGGVSALLVAGSSPSPATPSGHRPRKQSVPLLRHARAAGNNEQVQGHPG